ncbi:hypothetical protein DFAR_570019 [Desulfarculales bacterium]
MDRNDRDGSRSLEEDTAQALVRLRQGAAHCVSDYHQLARLCADA